MVSVRHSTYCPRALELANHFAEWAGFECDYNLLPAVSTRRGFLREYLMTYRSIANQSSHVGESETFNEELDRLMEEVDMYRGFPGFYWYAFPFSAIPCYSLARYERLII